jgi:trans-2,3-dihydro-3-hydroxyanthranilate isomerase
MLGLAPDDVADDAPAEFGSAGVPFLYVPLRTLDAVGRARADAVAISRFFAGRHHPAVYLFTLETESTEAAAHARMFSLALGNDVREDPATGGASGPFGAYLVRHGLRPPGKLLLEQGYEMGRPSQIVVEIQVQAGVVSQVTVGGGVVMMAEGHLLVE